MAKGHAAETPDPRVLACLTGAAAVLGVLTMILLFSTF